MLIMNLNQLFLKNYKMPLINFAAKCNSIYCIKVLIKNGANINIYDNSGWLPIHYASIYHEPYKNDSLRIILSSPNVKVNLFTIGGSVIKYTNVKMNTKGKTAFELANHYLCYGSCKLIEEYIKKKVSAIKTKNKLKKQNYKKVPIAPMAIPYNPLISPLHTKILK